MTPWHISRAWPIVGPRNSAEWDLTSEMFGAGPIFPAKPFRDLLLCPISRVSSFLQPLSRLPQLSLLLISTSRILIFLLLLLDFAYFGVKPEDMVNMDFPSFELLRIH